MSSIITSFFIDPVVRQARRFSTEPNQQPANLTTKSCDATERQHNDLVLQEDRASSHASSCTTPVSTHHVPASQRHFVSGSSLMNPTSSASHGQRTASASSLGQVIFDRFVPLVSRSGTSVSTTDTSSRRRQGDRRSTVAAIQGPQVENSGRDQTCAPIAIRSRRNASDPGPEPLHSTRNTDPLSYPPSPSATSTSLPMTFQSRDRAMWLSRLSVSSNTLERVYHSGRRMSRGSASQEHDFNGSGLLPEDDGQTGLRQRLREIWEEDLSSDEKARKMHEVMNESYLASRIEMPSKSPGSIQSLRLQRSSGSFGSELSCGPILQPPTCSAPPFDPSNPYNICTQDLKPSYHPFSPEVADAPFATEPNKDDASTPTPEFGCVHYKRNVKIQCYDCKTWWPCRCCHDEAQLGHELPRHCTENMLCMLCKTPGPAGQYCKQCSARAAYYFCEICKLWDDSTRSIYHCPDCGICRLGEGIGKDYQHCKKCNVCIPIQHHIAHKCIERATECDCPICGGYLFNSSAAIVAMPCGHYLHQSCYSEYIATAYQCPVCKKSAVNMELQWRKLEDEIAQQPMPARWRGTIVEVRCNDCGGKSRCNYHWLGNRCGLCDSFNTVEVQVIGREGENGMRSRPQRETVAQPASGRRSPASALQPRTRSYFQGQEGDEDPGDQAGVAGASEPGFGLTNTAYEMLARMSRSLSPLRHYFEDGEEHHEGSERPAGEREGDSNVELWADDDSVEDEGSDEDSYDESDDDDSLASGDEENDEGEEEDDSSDEGGLDLRLIGHR